MRSRSPSDGTNDEEERRITDPFKHRSTKAKDLALPSFVEGRRFRVRFMGILQIASMENYYFYHSQKKNIEIEILSTTFR